MSQHDDTLRSVIRQHLNELQEEGENKDLLRDLLERMMQEMLDLEFDQFLGAKRYERNESRTGYRNGYRQRELITRVGRLTLLVPRDREGRFSTQLFERYQRSEKALVLALQESYL